MGMEMGIDLDMDTGSLWHEEGALRLLQLEPREKCLRVSDAIDRPNLGDMQRRRR